MSAPGSPVSAPALRATDDQGENIPPNTPPLPAPGPAPEPPRPDDAPPTIEEPPRPGGAPPVQEPPGSHPPASMAAVPCWAMVC